MLFTFYSFLKTTTAVPFAGTAVLVYDAD
jgi:hypothetical protein